jgi:hypothetical protein
MSKHLFIINDNGEFYAITGARIELDNNFVVNPELYFETLQEDFFYLVRGLVDSGNAVKFLKVPGRTSLVFEDLVVTPMDQVTLYKAKMLSKGKHLLKQRCDFIMQFDFFQFSVLNNRLIDAGYVITDTNREVKYLEVISTGDDKLIGYLDAFLECKDRITVSNHNYVNFLAFQESVNSATNILEVDAAYTTFTALYN